MKRVYVNEEWCLGCHLCEYYCAFAQTNQVSMARALKGRKIHPHIRVEESGAVHFAVSCRHCEIPLCVKGCITGALSIDNGIIKVDESRCIGCFTCILSCPYGAISPSPDGHAARKCELCQATAAGVPLCAANCPNQAIVYEDRG
ncbi:MAG: 4Fe-4S binding protein [Clostridiales bacterium]|nr:4Fe-4S binding protein [Clostridiales bacterium]